MKRILLPLLIGCFGSVSLNAVPGDLVEKLGADDFATRNEAQKGLLKWAKTAKKGDIKELKKMHDSAESPEVKVRLLDILDQNNYEALPNTRGFVGISMFPVNGGVQVNRVEKGTPAEKVGLKVGDLIEGVDGIDLSKKVKHAGEAQQYFSAYVKGKNAGEKLELKIKRNGKVIEKTLKLGDYDKFHKGLWERQNQMRQQGILPQNGNNFRIGPRAQLKIAPQRVPNAQEEALRKEMEKQFRAQLKKHEERHEQLKKKLLEFEKLQEPNKNKDK